MRVESCRKSFSGKVNWGQIMTSFGVSLRQGRLLECELGMWAQLGRLPLPACPGMIWRTRLSQGRFTVQARMGYLELHGWVGDWSRSSQWPLRHGHPSLPCGYQPSRPIIRILLGPYHTSQLYKEHQDTSRALRIPTCRTCDLFI